MSAGQALDHDLAVHEVHDGALGLDALGFARQMDRHRELEQLVHRHAIEIGVEQLVVDGVQLVFADQHARVARAVELERDQRVDARIRMQDPHQLLRIDGQRLGLGLGAAVQHGGNASLTPESSGFVAAKSIPAN